MQRFGFLCSSAHPFHGCRVSFGGLSGASGLRIIATRAEGGVVSVEGRE